MHSPRKKMVVKGRKIEPEPRKKMVVKGRKIEPENPKKVQPQSSSGKESSEEESETESEPGQPHVNQILPNSTVKKVGIEPSSSSKAHNESGFSSSEQVESESEDSGSESEGGGDYVIVPPAPKSVAAPQKSVLACGQDILKETPSKAGSKRTTKAMETKGVKKAKKVVDKSHGEPEPTSSKKKLELRPKGEVSVRDEVKKQPFERIIWSKDDEIVFLKGMIDCAEMNKSEPALLDLDQFHEFIKGKLHFDASRTQVQNKIKMLKKKYMSNRTKEVKNQCAPAFSKHHEQEAYLLSKEIWGKEISQTIVASPQSTVARKKQIRRKMEGGHNGKSDEMKMENGKSEDINVENEKSEDINMVNGDSDNLVRMLEIADGVASPSFNMDIWIRSIRTKYAADDMSQGAKEWCQLAVEEIELYDKKLTLMSAGAKLVISGLKSKIG